MSSAILQIESLSKSYRSHWSFRSTPSVHDVTLDVYRGESFGFLGPNGAGKTTTIKCILGLLKKTSGRVFFEGSLLEDPALHSGIGYLPELPYFYEHLTVGETLEFFASLHGIKGAERTHRVNKSLERVGIADRKNNPVRSLSKGLQQRLGFAQAIINRPRLLLLDEPFSGLDPVGRREMRELMHELRAQGTTLMLSSHILADVEEICDRVSIMIKGHLKSVFYLKDIPSLYGQQLELTLPEIGDVPVIAAIERSSILKRFRPTADGGVNVFQFQDPAAAHAALKLAAEAGVPILSFQTLSLRLEDIFVKMAAQTPLSEPERPVSAKTLEEGVAR